MDIAVLRRGSITVVDYRCDAGPADQPFVEVHDGFSLSYVRKGSFGYHARGEAFDLVAGSILVGHPGDEYVCTHDHGCGDECLSFDLAPTVVETIGGQTEIWRTGCVPPLPELMVLGALAQAAADGKSDVGLDRLWARPISGGGSCARSPPRSGSGALDRRKFARPTRPRKRCARGRSQLVSLSAAIHQSPWRDPAPIPGPLPAAPCGAAARRQCHLDHRYRVRGRVR